MALPVDLQNVTSFHNSSEDFSDSSRGGSSSGAGNTKRAVTHIFVSQHALAALVLFGLLFILASLVARRGRRYFDANLQESFEQEREGSEGSYGSEDDNNDGESRNIDFELENKLSTKDIVKERDLCTIEKEETKHVTFVDCAQ